MTRVAKAVDKLFCGNNNDYIVFLFYYLNIFFVFVTGTTQIGTRVQIKLRQCLKWQENVRGRVRNNNFECVKNRVFCHNHAPSFEWCLLGRYSQPQRTGSRHRSVAVGKGRERPWLRRLPAPALVSISCQHDDFVSTAVQMLVVVRSCVWFRVVCFST
jgi:hypothetical protein